MESGYTPAAQLAAEADTLADRDLERVGDHRVGLVPLKHQAQALVAPVRRLALLGGYGAGKTKGGAWRFIRACQMNGWRPVYGGDRPRFAVVAPTFRILKQSTCSQLDSVLPRSWIRRRRGTPHNDLELKNGTIIELHSAVSEIEGQTYAGLWVDEISHSNFHERLVANLVARVRDPNARMLTETYTGLPVAGWVRDYLDRPAAPRTAEDGGQWTILAATADNPNVPRETLNALLAAAPADEADTLVGGKWAMPLGAIYRELDAKTHIVDQRGDPRAPVDVAIDVGEHGAVVFGQRLRVDVTNVIGQVSPGNGLLIVDELLTEGSSVDGACYAIKTQKPWQIVPGDSVICVDPTIRRDEERVIRGHFPGVRIRKRDRSEVGYKVEDGIRAVRAALRDALGNARLYFARGLVGQKHGCLEALERARRNERGVRIKDDLRDHAEDVVRYLCQERLPLLERHPSRPIEVR